MFAKRLGLQSSLVSLVALSIATAVQAQSTEGSFSLTDFTNPSDYSGSGYGQSYGNYDNRYDNRNDSRYDNNRYDSRDRIDLRELSSQASRLESATRYSQNFELRSAGSRILSDAQSLERCSQNAGRRPAPGPGYPGGGYPYPGNQAPISDAVQLKQVCGYELRQIMISISEIEFQLIGLGAREPGLGGQVQRIARLKDQIVYGASNGGGGGYPPAPPAYRANGTLDAIAFDYIGNSVNEVQSQCQMDLSRRGVNAVGCVRVNSREFGQMCRMPPNGGVSRGMSAQEACSIVSQNATVLPRP